MKGQITKHEWEGNSYRKTCPHCGTIKERATLGSAYTYLRPGIYPSNIEPKCITRKIQADDNSKRSN